MNPHHQSTGAHHAPLTAFETICPFKEGDHIEPSMGDAMSNPYVVARIWEVTASAARGRRWRMQLLSSVDGHAIPGGPFHAQNFRLATGKQPRRKATPPSFEVLPRSALTEAEVLEEEEITCPKTGKAWALARVLGQDGEVGWVWIDPDPRSNAAGR